MKHLSNSFLYHLLNAVPDAPTWSNESSTDDSNSWVAIVGDDPC